MNCFALMQGVSWFAGGGWLIKLIHCGLFWVSGLMVCYWVGGLLCKTRNEDIKQGTQVSKKCLHSTPCVYGYRENPYWEHISPYCYHI